MTILDKDVSTEDLLKDLKIDCLKCFGFCCVALYFSKCDGFPKDKVSGDPCINLNTDFTCLVHKELRSKGLKGCTTYDCFGAGQKVAQFTYDGKPWDKFSNSNKEMFDTFLVMRKLHEMLWYLVDCLRFEISEDLEKKVKLIIEETNELTKLEINLLLKLNLENHRMKVNSILKEISQIVRRKFSDEKKLNSKGKKEFREGFDFIGLNLTKTNLIGANLSGTLLIASNLKNSDLSGVNFIGADMRDTDIRGANLENSIFVTQTQINSSIGDSRTKLPKNLVRPLYWEK